METENNIMRFDTDDEITDFCLSMNPTVFKDEIDGTPVYGYDYDWTPQYNDAIANNMMFTVIDPKSSVMKHSAVCRGCISKKLSNLIYE